MTQKIKIKERIKMINYIIDARIKGLREDFIEENFHKKRYPWEMIYDAFENANRRYKKVDDKSEITVTIDLEPKLKDALKKQAKKDGSTIDQEAQKMLAKASDRPLKEIHVKGYSIDAVYKGRK